MTRIYVIDTCYLLELYRVPGFSTDRHYAHVVDRLSKAAAAKSLFFVTLPCIVEVANHLADSASKQVSYEIGRKLLTDVNTSIQEHVPWQITPSYDSIKSFQSALSYFVAELLITGVGLCDAFTIKEANRLSDRYGSSGYEVHIMTLDRALKAREPNPDPDPYVGDE